MIKFQTIDFLKTLELLKDWSYIKLKKLNKHLTEKAYSAGDFIFKQGDEATVFYLIKKGSVLIETIIDIDEFNRYPVVKS